MAARRLVERRNPHETMDAGFGRQQSVGVIADDVNVALFSPASSPGW